MNEYGWEVDDIVQISPAHVEPSYQDLCHCAKPHNTGRVYLGHGACHCGGLIGGEALRRQAKQRAEAARKAHFAKIRQEKRKNVYDTRRSAPRRAR